MRALLVLLVLTAPSAAAEIQWIAPEDAGAGHPVHAAWAAVEAEEPLQLAHHVQADVRILLDEEVRFESGSVHEHDGLHTLVFTPDRPGTLRFEAVQDGQVEAREVPVAEARPATGVPWEEWLLLDVAAEERSGQDRLFLTGYHEVGNEHWNADVLWDVRDAEGRLLLSAAGNVNGIGLIVGGLPSAAVQATLTSASSGGSTFGARVLETVLAGDPPEGMSLVPGQGSCPSPQRAVVFDPEPLVQDALVFQEWTDVRVVLLDLEARPGTVFASLQRQGTPGADMLWHAFSSSMLPSFSFRTPGPGEYVLEIDDRTSCRVPLRIEAMDGPGLLPQDVAPGHVETDLHQNNGTLDVAFTPYGPDGQQLGHYEFDTRVVHLDDAEGRLVWQGKLHGHDGKVSFRLHGLAAGEYEIRTYPSPQTSGVPPVAAEGPEGFVHRVVVTEPEPEPHGQMESPWPAGAALMLVGLAMVLRRRR